MSDKVYTNAYLKGKDNIAVIYGEDPERDYEWLEDIINAQNERIAALEAQVRAQGIRIDSLLFGFGEPLK